MVTIAVDEDVWRYLTVRKEPGDSMNDVIRRELALGDNAQSEEAEVGIEELFSEWEPGTEADTDRARREAVRAAGWLRDRGGRAKKSDFIDGLEFDQHVDSWWGRCVQPGLRELDDQGVVEYRSGYHDYQWLG